MKRVTLTITTVILLLFTLQACDVELGGAGAADDENGANGTAGEGIDPASVDLSGHWNMRMATSQTEGISDACRDMFFSDGEDMETTIVLLDEGDRLAIDDGCSDEGAGEGLQLDEFLVTDGMITWQAQGIHRGVFNDCNDTDCPDPVDCDIVMELTGEAILDTEDSFAGEGTLYAGFEGPDCESAIEQAQNDPNVPPEDSATIANAVDILANPCEVTIPAEAERINEDTDASDLECDGGGDNGGDNGGDDTGNGGPITSCELEFINTCGGEREVYFNDGMCDASHPDSPTNGCEHFAHLIDGDMASIFDHDPNDYVQLIVCSADIDGFLVCEHIGAYYNCTDVFVSENLCAVE